MMEPLVAVVKRIIHQPKVAVTITQLRPIRLIQYIIQKPIIVVFPKWNLVAGTGRLVGAYVMIQKPIIVVMEKSWTEDPPICMVNVGTHVMKRHHRVAAMDDYTQGRIDVAKM